MENNSITDVNKEKNNIFQQLVKIIKNKLEERILVIDRFENDVAVCEDRNTGKMHNIKISKLPKNVKESDVIQFKNNKYEINENLKKEIQKDLEDKMRNLFND